MLQESLDPVTFEILRHRLWQIADEMGVNLRRVSGSPVVTDASDFMCALYRADGDVVILGSGALMHVSTTSMVCKRVLEKYSRPAAGQARRPGVREGDMYLFNDPYLAVAHQSDFSIISPIFFQGELVAWTGSMSHVADTGGIDPGGMCPRAETVFHEGIRFAGIRIVVGGEIQEDVFDSILGMVRDPGMVGLDMRAQIAANNTGRQRLLDLIGRYGLATVRAAMDELIHYSEARMRARLREIPDGTWRTVAYQDHDGQADRIYRVPLAMTKEGDTLTFDFTGTSDQAPGFANSTYWCTRAGLTCAIVPLLCYDIPWNQGVLKPVQVVIPEGSFLNPRFPAPVSMGSIGGANVAWNAATITISKMLGATEKYQEEVCAVWRGGASSVVGSGINRDGQFFSMMFFDHMAGGCGARAFADGVDTGGAIFLPRPMSPNVETFEMLYPVFYLYRRQAEDTGGPGRFRGGVGGEYGWIPQDALADKMTAVLLAMGLDPAVSTGLFGGYPANNISWCIVRNSDVHAWLERGDTPAWPHDLEGEMETLPAKGVVQVGPQDAFFVRWIGGGGYGDPLEREADRVRQDVEKGLVSPQVAREVYGVVLDPQTLEVDTGATHTHRSRVRQERLAQGQRGRDFRPAGGENGPRRRLAECLELAHWDGGPVVQCRRCHHPLGPGGENWKSYAVYRESPLTRAGPKMKGDGRFILREFFCPACATLLETEMVQRGDPAIWDLQLKL